jgi:hypothetical protein
MGIFQISLPLSSTQARVAALDGAYASSHDSDHSSILDSIEAEGWKLEHADYVYRMTRSFSRDKLLSSGQQEAIEGEILGI